MDAAVELVKVVARAFYEEKYVVLLDFLLRERMYCLLADRMQVLLKDIHKIAAKLRDDRLIKFESRQETRVYDQKLVTRTYYFLDLPCFVDVVTFKLHRMGKTLEDRIKNELNEKGYYCSYCKKTFSAFDVPSLVNPITFAFECETCRNELSSVDASMLSFGAQAQSRIMEQTNLILRLLKRLDTAYLPKFDPSEYLRTREAFKIVSPLESADEDTPSSASSKITVAGSRPEPVFPKIQVEIADFAQKPTRHVMPEWHTHSTVTGLQSSHAPLRQAAPSTSEAHQRGGSEDAIRYIQHYESYHSSAVTRGESDKRPRSQEQEHDPSSALATKPESTATATATLTPNTNVQIAVQGVMKNILEITEHDKNAMTEEEYQRYYEEFVAMGLE